MAFQLHNGMGSAFFITNTWGNTSAGSSSGTGTGNSGRSRPGTSSGEQRDRDPTTQQVQAQTQAQQKNPGSSSGATTAATTTNVLTKDRDRKPSFSRRPSFTSPSKSKRRASLGGGDRSHHIKTDASTPPAIPDFALAQAAAAKLSKETEAVVISPTTANANSTDNRTTSSSGRNALMSSATMNGHYSSATSPPTIPPGPGLPIESSSFSVHQHIHDLANKRISTLDYLRKAYDLMIKDRARRPPTNSHEGRIYWFNTLQFDKGDLARMPFFDSRKLARRATNYLLLGLSLPAVIDLSSSTPLEFLRSLNMLLAEFESYQQIHTENGTNTSTLSRAARIPSMFRRGAGGRGRRQSAGGDGDALPDGGGHDQQNGTGVGGGLSNGLAMMSSGTTALSTAGSVINFGLGGEGADLLPGEEYAHLLTPNLPFDPDFFETFASLCDVLIDCYTRLMSLLPTARDCGPGVAELFGKADAKVRKLIVQGVVKEFEDASRAGLKQEMTSVGKVVLGGLM
ncbi:hypothetical protein SLS62_006180 [Diatrype stigma]|uniref:Uncharacterized protein n=1 Tax=Diatrype stigma TaxID=117547 RepID=A0AAN9YRV9_9PEZI